MKPKRKICFPIMSRVHYARQGLLLSLLKNHPGLDLQIVVGGSVLLDKYGKRFLPAMVEKGFSPHDTLYNVIDGGTHVTMAKTAGLAALEFSNSLYKLNPDIVIIRGDRFEQLAIAMSAAYLNKTIAHIEGGDVTGTIDESVRHAITKLSHIHFVTNDAARGRVIQMGENPEMVFNVGSPDIEYAATVKKKLNNKMLRDIGVGAEIDFSFGEGSASGRKKPYIMVMHHPVTTETDNAKTTENILKTVDGLNMQAIWFWPNSDAGTNDIAKVIRQYRETGKLKNNKIKFITDLLPEDFLALLKGASVLVGNSSAGIKEASYFGTPVVNVGTRQAGRLRGPNVCDVGSSASAIKKAVESQIAHGRYPKSDLYYRADTSRRIAEILATVPLQSQKKFYDK